MVEKAYYTDNILKDLFFNPIYQGGKKLCISVAHATPSMASWLLTEYKECDINEVSVELVICSTKEEGILKDFHEGFIALQKEFSNKKFRCSYLSEPCSLQNNSFIWLQDDKPFCAFQCTYDFTQMSLMKVEKGLVYIVNPINEYEKYKSMLGRTVYCNYQGVEEQIVIYSRGSCLQRENDNLEKCVLSLLTKNGDVGTRSGLNWGHRGNRNRNQAYIPLSSEIAKSGFFPLNKQHFLVITDDDHTLELRVEQQNNKAITTPSSNALLGEYFRNRLGLANGAFITREDLEKYGRFDVTFYKYDAEHYYMDFSSKNINK